MGSTAQSDADEYKFSPILVKFSDGESSVCSTGGTRTSITFARDPGDLPPVYIKFNKLTSSDGKISMLTPNMVLALLLVIASGAPLKSLAIEPSDRLLAKG